MKNKNPKDDIELIDQYYHIDNGGITVRLTASNNGDGPGGYFLNGIEIGNSFYGYTTNTMTIHTLYTIDNVSILEDLGKKLLIAAERIKELNKK